MKKTGKDLRECQVDKAVKEEELSAAQTLMSQVRAKALKQS